MNSNIRYRQQLCALLRQQTDDSLVCVTADIDDVDDDMMMVILLISITITFKKNNTVSY